MKTQIHVCAVILAALVASAACSNPGAPTVDNGSGNGNGTTVNGQVLSLAIDGVAFQPTVVDVSSAPAIGPLLESLSIIATAPSSGSNPSQSVSILVPSRVGTYDVRSTLNMLVRYQRGAVGLEQWWEASGPLGSGTVEITSRTVNSAEGRVTVTMAPSGMGAGSVSKTCTGTFSVRF